MTTKANKAKTAPVAEKVQGIKILGQPEKPYRENSARALYWDSVQAFAKAGKSYAQWAAFVEDPKTCPLHAPARLAKENKLNIANKGSRAPEKASGWWGHFDKRGLVAKI